MSAANAHVFFSGQRKSGEGRGGEGRERGIDGKT